MRIEELLAQLPDAGWLTPEVRARLGLDALLLAAWADGEAAGARAVGVRALDAAEVPDASSTADTRDRREPAGSVNRCSAGGVVRLAPDTLRRLGIPAGGAVVCWPPDEPRPAESTAWVWVESLEGHLQRSLAGTREPR